MAAVVGLEVELASAAVRGAGQDRAAHVEIAGGVVIVLADVDGEEYPSDTRQLTQGEGRIATGDGPPWLVVVLLVLAVSAVAGYVTLR